MRLRAEYMRTENESEDLRDLEQMHAMVAACLSYLRGGARQEFITSILQPCFTPLWITLSTGRRCQFDGASEIIVNGNPDELERAFSNLVDNAVKFAGGAELSVTRQRDTAIVEVADHGPGIRRKREKQCWSRSDGAVKIQVWRQGRIWTWIGDRAGRLHGASRTAGIGRPRGGGLSVRVELPSHSN